MHVIIRYLSIEILDISAAGDKGSRLDKLKNPSRQ